jgi:hypothetical protein
MEKTEKKSIFKFGLKYATKIWNGEIEISIL